MFVRVKWLKSPRGVCYAHSAGSSSLVLKDKAEEFAAMNLCVIMVKPVERKPEVKDTMAKKVYTRPVTREKKS